MAWGPFDGAGSIVEAGQIRDVSLTTPVTQRITLGTDLILFSGAKS